MKVKVAACFLINFFTLPQLHLWEACPKCEKKKKERKKNSLSWFCSKPGSFPQPSLVVGIACVLQNTGVNLAVLNVPPVLQTWLLHLIFLVSINKTEGCILDITQAVFDIFTMTNLPCQLPPFYHWLIPVPPITGPLPCQPHPIGLSDYWSHPHVGPHSHQPLPLVDLPLLVSPSPPHQSLPPVASPVPMSDPSLSLRHCSTPIGWLLPLPIFLSSPLLALFTFPSLLSVHSTQPLLVGVTIPCHFLSKKKSYPFACSGLHLCTQLTTVTVNLKPPWHNIYITFTRAPHCGMKLGSAWLICLFFSFVLFCFELISCGRLFLTFKIKIFCCHFYIHTCMYLFSCEVWKIEVVSTVSFLFD